MIPFNKSFFMPTPETPRRGRGSRINLPTLRPTDPPEGRRMDFGICTRTADRTRRVLDDSPDSLDDRLRRSLGIALRKSLEMLQRHACKNILPKRKRKPSLGILQRGLRKGFRRDQTSTKEQQEEQVLNISDSGEGARISLPLNPKGQHHGQITVQLIQRDMANEPSPVTITWKSEDGFFKVSGPPGAERTAEGYLIPDARRINFDEWDVVQPQ